MKYNRLGYLIGEGLSNVFKNKKSTVASIVIMCATMIIFGLFLIIGENVNHFVDNLKLQQGFQVFMKEDATQGKRGYKSIRWDKHNRICFKRTRT